MSVLFYTLGVDQFFSYHGDINYLQDNLPIVDLVLAWVAAHSDVDGDVTSNLFLLAIDRWSF